VNVPSVFATDTGMQALTDVARPEVEKDNASAPQATSRARALSTLGSSRFAISSR
jgi:hypothetical protein